MTPEQARRWQSQEIQLQPDEDVITYHTASADGMIIAEVFGYHEGEFIVRVVSPASRLGDRQRGSATLVGSTLDAAIDDAELLLRDLGWELRDTAGVAADDGDQSGVATR